jgi:hypothetical protein
MKQRKEKEKEKFFISPRQYSLENLETYIQTSYITIKANKNLNRVKILSDITVYFREDSIGSLLGFNNGRLIEPKKLHLAEDIPKLIPFETINIHLNLADGMFIREIMNTVIVKQTLSLVLNQILNLVRL